MSNLKVKDGVGADKYLHARGIGSDADPHIQTNKDIMLAIAEGEVSGMSVVHKFGFSKVIGTSITPITTSGEYQTPTALTSIEILSSDVNDTSAGTGAQKVKIQGLTTAWASVEEEVTMNGTTPVALANQYFRIFRAFVSESGTYATSAASSHAGVLTIRTAGAGATWAEIGQVGTYGVGQTQIGVYTVPAGKTAYVQSKFITVDASKPVDIFMFQRPNADDVTTPFTGAIRVVQQHTGAAGVLNVHPATPLGPFLEKTDVGFMATVTTGTASASVDFEIILIDN